jgi:hypothetical protein
MAREKDERGRKFLLALLMNEGWTYMSNYKLRYLEVAGKPSSGRNLSTFQRTMIVQQAICIHIDPRLLVEQSLVWVWRRPPPMLKLVLPNDISPSSMLEHRVVMRNFDMIMCETAIVRACAFVREGADLSRQASSHNKKLTLQGHYQRRKIHPQDENRCILMNETLRLLLGHPSGATAASSLLASKLYSWRTCREP